MPLENKKLSIIVPIFNEIKIIEKFITSLSNTFEKKNCQYIFIDDGSFDGTVEKTQLVLNNIFNKNDFKYVRLNKNFGKAKAVKEGIKFIEGEYTLLIDSDLEYLS